MARAGYIVWGYTPEQVADWNASVAMRKGAEKRAKPAKISGMLETLAGATAYADLVRKQGGEVTDIRATIGAALKKK
jgi:hypothetical protein